jgi:hypothetical protein
MPQGKGKSLPLSPGRKLVIEMLEHARRVPSVPVARTMDVALVREAREQVATPPSWTAIFLRAYALVARECCGLRRTLIPWPTPHLYEHPSSIGALVVERHVEGEPILLAAKVRSPEDTTLEAIDQHLRRFKQAPVEEISAFRQLLRIGKLPGWLRRFTFWHSLYISGRIRAKRFGTFMVSSYGSLGAEQMHPLTPLTTLLTFGPIAANGSVIVKIVYDHRVLDGRYVAGCLNDLDRVLNTDILAELRLKRLQAA